MRGHAGASLGPGAGASGLRSSLQRHLGSTRTQGWTESQLAVSLLLLNLAGGESVDDVRILEQDEGLGQVVRSAELHGVRGRERRARARRWRRGRRRSLPSPSALFRYLESFHDSSQERLRVPGRAFIPAPGAGLCGLGRVNADLMRFVQRLAPREQATLDMDATVVETAKRTALRSYEGTRAYQPLTTYWAEAGMVVHSEFRDGNVPAGHEQRRVLEEALGHLLAGVERVLLRSDTAGYQWELLRYCAEGRSERFGVVEFAVGVDVSPAFKAAVSEVDEAEWRELAGGEGESTGQEYRGLLRPGRGRALPEGPGLSIHRDPGAAAQSAFAGDGRPRTARRRAPGRGLVPHPRRGDQPDAGGLGAGALVPGALR